MLTLYTPKRRVIVRWPFRGLAALILVLFVLTMGATFWQWYREGSFGPHEQLLVQLPAFLWFGRLLFFAVTRASLPPSGNAWPFATDRLLFTYLGGLMACHYLG